MNPEPTATPAPAPTANESGLSLETEPLLFFNPTLAGLAVPGSIQPFAGPLSRSTRSRPSGQRSPSSHRPTVGADTYTTSKRLTTSVRMVRNVRGLRRGGTS